MEIPKVCPFRTEGKCDSDCQLFVLSASKNIHEGKCALSALPILQDLHKAIAPINGHLAGLNQVLVNIARAMPPK